MVRLRRALLANRKHRLLVVLAPLLALIFLDVSEAGSALPFQTDLDKALELSREDGRPLFVMFVAAWCPICSEMKREALSDPSVTAHLDDIRWVAIDIDRSTTVARRWGIEAVPTILLLSAAGEPRRRLAGERTADEIHAELTGLLGGGEAFGDTTSGEPAATDRARSDLIWSPKGYRGAGICFSHVGYGPLSLYSQSPFQALRLGIRPRTPSTLGRGEREIRATTTWVNTWASAPEYFLDFEALQAVLAIGYGITDTVQLELEVQQRDRFGGALDPFVQGFHDLFGIDQNGRSEVPHGEFSFDLEPRGGSAVQLTSGDRGPFTRSLQVSIQHNLTCGTAHLPAISYSVTTRLETVDVGDLSDGGDVDFGVSLSLARRMRQFYLYGTLGHAWFGRDRFRGLPLKNSQYTMLGAVEWRFRRNQSFLLQYLGTEGLSPDFEPFSDMSHEITIGWKWEVVSRTVIEVGLIENLISYNNSPDFGIHAGVVHRF